MGKGLSKFAGHLFALIASLFWGTTFLATDYLLVSFTTLQLLAMRFLLGYLILLLIKPKRCIQKPKTEISFVLMSLFGVLIYYYLENLAVFHNGANNTSILVGCVPMMTVILMCITGKMTRVTLTHIVGFAIAIAGIVLVVYNGSIIEMNLNAIGTGCAMGACFCWGIYSLLADNNRQVNSIIMARRTLFWSMLITVALALIKDGLPDFAPLFTPEGGVALGILGLFGSGLCYFMWNRAISLLGVDIATNYIYAIPFITMAASAILGTETISVMGFIGAGLILVGVVISDLANPDKPNKENKTEIAPNENQKPKKGQKNKSKEKSKEQKSDKAKPVRETQSTDDAQSRYLQSTQNRAYANARRAQEDSDKK